MVCVLVLGVMPMCPALFLLFGGPLCLRGWLGLCQYRRFRLVVAWLRPFVPFFCFALFSLCRVCRFEMGCFFRGFVVGLSVLRCECAVESSSVVKF